MSDNNQNNEQNHNCDLFMLSSHTPYYAKESLTNFAIRGKRNIHGWGIGSYIDGKSNIVRSAISATTKTGINEEFKSTILSTRSPLIIGHLRLASRGGLRVENNHPFMLNFLGYEWLLVHNGSARNADSLVRHDERLLLDSDNDTPRIFEFLRKHIIEYYLQRPTKSLIEACRNAYNKLLEKDSGKFNIILSNGYLTFVFVHWRDFYMLHREKESGDVAILSTLQITDNEIWEIFRYQENINRGKKAKMLVFSGNTLILNGDIPR